MYPTIFELPLIHHPLSSFGLMVAIGFILAVSIFQRLAARNFRDPEKDVERFANLPVWILIGIFLGARVFYVIVEVGQGTPVGKSYYDEPWRVLAVWEGGLVMYGGLFGGLLGGIWCARKYGIEVKRGIDEGLTAGFFGLATGRIGCLLVGDDYGHVVPEAYRDLPFPITVTIPNPLPDGSLFGAANAGQVLWATQVWMCLNALLIGLGGLWLLRRRKYFGQVSGILVLWYALTRGTIEFFRGDKVRGLWFDGALSTSQIISIAVAAIALYWIVRLRDRRDPELAH